MPSLPSRRRAAPPSANRFVSARNTEQANTSCLRCCRWFAVGACSSTARQTERGRRERVRENRKREGKVGQTDRHPGPVVRFRGSSRHLQKKNLFNLAKHDILMGPVSYGKKPQKYSVFQQRYKKLVSWSKYHKRSVSGSQFCLNKSASI